MHPTEIAIVGAGPRGTVTLERLCANAAQRPDAAVRVHIIEPHEPGPGRVWRRDQHPSLLMNSVASDITAFCDDTVQCDGPPTVGPNQFEWTQYSASQWVSSERLRAEAVHMRPWSYSSRALHGEYLRWAFERTVASAPPSVDIVVHRSSATSLAPAPRQKITVRLGSDEALSVAAVVLAVGHYDLEPSDEQRELMDCAHRHGLTYIPPSNASEIDLGSIPAGKRVILRGMGLTFFDYVTLLTSGRGGRFITKRGVLTYIPSGHEPVLLAGSRTGVPYRARAEFIAESPTIYRPRYFTSSFAHSLRSAAAGKARNFRSDVWPVLRKEIAWAYYCTLLNGRVTPARLAKLFDDNAFDIDRLPQLVEQASGIQVEHLAWDDLLTPAAARHFADPTTYNSWVADYLRQDLRAAQRGPGQDPLKALAAAVRDVRSVVRAIVSYGGVTGSSYRDDVEGWFNSLNNQLASGPPRSRVEELLALHQAGIVEFIGPAPDVRIDPQRSQFCVRSAAVDRSERDAAALIESYLPNPDLRRADNPLLASMLARGMCRPYRISNGDGSFYESGGFEVEQGTMRAVDRNGIPHPNIFCFGPPTEGVQWVTASGARPGINSQLLAEADAIAHAIIAAAPWLICKESAYEAGAPSASVAQTHRLDVGPAEPAV